MSGTLNSLTPIINMKAIKLFSILFSAAVVFSCQQPKPKISTHTFVQYNVGAFHKSESSSVKAIADAVRELQADVVSLNEVDSCTARTGQVDQLAAFAQEMGQWNQHYAAAMPYDGGAYGVGVASKPELNIVRKDMIALPQLDGKEPRAVAVVEYEDFVYCSTHLDLTEESQLGQMKAINHYMDSLYKDSVKPILIGGDFNCEPDSAPVKYMLESWALITPQTYSYPSHKPIKCIDFIFARPQGKKIIVEKSEIPVKLSSADLATASDHLPVVLKVTIE